MPFPLYTDIDTDFPTTDLVGEQLAAIEAIDGQSWTRSVEGPSSVVGFLGNQPHDLSLGHDGSDCSLDELLGLTSWPSSDYLSSPVRTHQDKSDATQAMDITGEIPFVLQFRPLAAQDNGEPPDQLCSIRTHRYTIHPSNHPSPQPTHVLLLIAARR